MKAIVMPGSKMLRPWKTEIECYDVKLGKPLEIKVEKMAGEEIKKKAIQIGSLKKRLDDIDVEFGHKAIEGFYQSRFLIYMGEWEKGKTIVSFLGGVKKKPNYLEMERQTDRSDSSLKIWHDLYLKWPDRKRYITGYAEPKAEAWAKKALLPAHVGHATGENEWFTPPDIIEAARRAMGSIDCDPASSEKANKIVKAKRFFSIENDGLTQEWRGNIWMNPPYAQPAVDRFCEGVTARYEAGEIKQACVLVNNATETAWFQRMLERAAAVCFIRGRVKFLDIEGKPGAPLQGQAVLYFGPGIKKFISSFSGFGGILKK